MQQNWGFRQHTSLWVDMSHVICVVNCKSESYKWLFGNPAHKNTQGQTVQVREQQLVGEPKWLWECQGQAIKEKDGTHKGLKYLLNNIIRGGCKDKCLSGNQCSASLQRSQPQQDEIKNVRYIDYEIIRCFTFGIIALYPLCSWCNYIHLLARKMHQNFKFY